MNDVHEDRFVVFVRSAQGHAESLGNPTEQPLASYPTYKEARQFRETLHGSANECVIRFVGPAGGGD